jgi:hypothetical protein
MTCPVPGHKALFRSLSVLLLGAALATGCTEATEVGKPCQLVKKPSAEEAAAGALTAPVLERDLVAGQDFISFGATDCVDLVCVHDKDAPTSGNPDAVAIGYCSEACIPGEDSCSKVSGDAVEGLEARMSCRALLLDQETLNRLRTEDPALYRSTFGDNTNPFFCAGATPAAQ